MKRIQCDKHCSIDFNKMASFIQKHAAMNWIVCLNTFYVEALTPMWWYLEMETIKFTWTHGEIKCLYRKRHQRFCCQSLPCEHTAEGTSPEPNHTGTWSQTSSLQKGETINLLFKPVVLVFCYSRPERLIHTPTPTKIRHCAWC